MSPFELHDRSIRRMHEVLARLDDHSLHTQTPVPSPFPPSLGPAEHMLAAGPYERLTVSTVDHRIVGPDATPRWAPARGGTVWLSQRGIYLQSETGLWACPWSVVESVDLLGPRRIGLTRPSSRGPVVLGLRSDWAELAFVLWARLRRPDHPLLVDDAWATLGATAAPAY